MDTFAKRVKDLKVDKGTIGLFFLGQAGFILKDSLGTLIAIDPYLSNCCERHFGFKRLMAYILDPKELVFDYIIASHGHYDHLDIDSIYDLVDNDMTRLYTTLDGIEELNKLGITKGTLIKREDRLKGIGKFSEIRFVYADHGDLAPHAVGIVFTLGDKKIYFAGDTCYRPEHLVNDYTKNCDLAILPINGQFGNLNEKEAIMLAKDLKAKLIVPCHFWNFAEHKGDPSKFMEYAKEEKVPYCLMTQGEHIII